MAENQSSIDVAISAELCRRSFFEFFCEFWETIEAVELIPNWHIKYLCDQLQACFERWKRKESQPDLIVNVPPGTSKSTSCTQLFPAWLWVVEPSMRIITSSYSGDLSTGHAVKSRDCLKSDKFQLYYPGLIEFKNDSDGKTAYKNTKKGERYTTSTGGAVTGTHGDCIIIDDPINPKKAASDVERKTANQHVNETLSTRKTDKKRTFTILVMQRLHEKDPTGEWLKKKAGKVTHICLPGEESDLISPAHLRSKYTNGLLDANRLDREALDKLKTDLGSYGYAGQIMQNPAPDGGGTLKRHWFGKITFPEFLQKYGTRPVWNFDADTAYTKNQENDPTGMLASCYIDNMLFIREAAADWLELPDLVKQLPEFVKRNGYTTQSKLHVEPKASGKSTVQTLKQSTKLNVVEAPSPKDDKETRVSSVSPFIETGRVVLIDGSWNEAFLHQCATFPKGEHDDMLDCMVQAIERINNPVKKGTKGHGAF